MPYVVSLRRALRRFPAWVLSLWAACLPSAAHAVADDNSFVWPFAIEIPLVPNASGNFLEGSARASINAEDLSRWFKFKVQPGSRVVVTVTELAENYDLVLFKDIAEAYNELTQPSDLTLIDAEFADDAFSPAQFSPAQFSPAQFSPAAFSPAQFSPAQFSPAQFSPAQFSPAQFSPAQFSPDAFAPAQFSPAQFSPAQFSPAQFSPAQFSPAQFSPAQFSEEAYASAQTRSVIAVSAFDGLLPEGVVANTWDEDSFFYVRIRSRQGVPNRSPCRVNVFLFPGLCSDLKSVPVDGNGQPLPASTTRAPAGGYRTLILTDLDRLTGPGASVARDAILAKLTALAGRPEVQGVILDVASDPWVAFFNTQADQNRQCSFAKNLVADAIHQIIERSRQGNALEYIVLVGGDGVIPFFRHPDEALLGPEVDYYPPVFEFTASQASLRNNLFLSQDRYGARCEISRKLSRLPIPDLAVGRLVETPAEIANMVDAYLENPGGVRPTPTSALVTGYDFLEDAAIAVADDLQAGMGSVVDRLISPRDMAPADPASWTATDLTAALLGKRHDILFLAGHFSAASALAADYRTAVRASQLFDAPTGFFRNTLFYSAGCHSGYNVVDSDAIPGITPQPDWAQTSAQLGMTLLAGTGYQYGDTDFLEYSERLYFLFTRQLRTGNGPVAVGRALVRAKQEYLASTADLRGIHEKALYQASLFGLPMFSVNMTGARLQNSGDAPLGGTTLFSTAPGSQLGLRFADLTLNPTLTPHTLVLNDAEQALLQPNAPATVTAKWYSGPDGVVVQPAEPVLPLVIHPVHVDGLALRGIGFRGGRYTDEADIIPLTGAATTEIRGVHPAFLSDIFFPAKFWRANYFGVLCETDGIGTRLMATPAQFQSYPADARGVLRTHQRLDFRLYYSDNIATYTQDLNNDSIPDTSATPALSSPPQISNVQAKTEGNQIRFRVQVVGNPAAGIQEVWVVYTAIQGARHGTWAPLDLQQTADSRFWEGTIPIGNEPAEAVRFLVQAVNGVGLIASASNLGAYFIPNQTATPTTPPAPTSVELISPPTEGTYGSRVTLSARLTSAGSPLAGRQLVFRIGALQARALTDASGVAQVSLNLLHQPSNDPLVLSANWAGTAQFAPSSASAPFLLRRSATSLTLAPNPALVPPSAPETMSATLTDASGRSVAEQTLIFVVSGDAGTQVVPAITDYSGLARLGSLSLPAGSYNVSATFGQRVQPPAPFAAVGDAHPLYAPSSAVGTLTIDPNAPTAHEDEVIAQPGKPLKISASQLLGNDSDPAGTTLRVVATSPRTGRGVTVTQSGAWLFLGNLPTNTGADAFEYTIANAANQLSTARVVLRLISDEAPSSNLLDATPESGRLRIRFFGIPGRTYRIQFSPTTSPAQWVPIGQALVGPGGIGTFLTPPNVGTSGFFRTVYP